MSTGPLGSRDALTVRAVDQVDEQRQRDPVGKQSQGDRLCTVVHAEWVGPGQTGVDRRTGEVIERSLAGTPADLVFGGGALWVALTDTDERRSCMWFVPLEEDGAYQGGRLDDVGVTPGVGVATPLRAGETLKLTLRFERSGEKIVDFKVAPAMGGMAH